MAFVAGAGPIANVAVAVVAAVVARAMELGGIEGIASQIAFFIVFYNLLLAVFNLLPIPPLDGYNVVLAFAPPRTAFTIQRYAQYGVIVLLMLVFLPNSPLGLMFNVVRGLTRALTGA